MDTPQAKSRKEYVLDWAWKKQLLNGLPKGVREAFNAGFNFGFSCGVKKGREDAAAKRQLNIPGT